MSLITVERKVLEKNDVIAGENRKIFRDNHIFVINMLSSPGAGKTTIIEKTISELKNKIKIAVIEGDVQTDLDARRIDTFDIPVVQIVTNGGCHLEANLVKDAFSRFDSTDINLLIIENVGNLVCPAGYDLGEDLKIVIATTTEGEDKPLKYPAIFRNAGAMLINKIDLLPYLSTQSENTGGLKFSIDILKQNALSINPALKIFDMSCMTGQGIDEWCKWLISNIKAD